MNRLLAISFLFLSTAGAPAVFAAGSRSLPQPQQQVPQVPQKTADPVTPFKEGVALMNAKKFAAAQVKFEAGAKIESKHSRSAQQFGLLSAEAKS